MIFICFFLFCVKNKTLKLSVIKGVNVIKCKRMKKNNTRRGWVVCLFEVRKKNCNFFLYPSKRYNYCCEILLGGVKVQSIRRKMENLKRLRDSFLFFL